MVKKIIHFSRFVPVTHLGGGARRTLQIDKILAPFLFGMISSGRGGGIQDLSPKELDFFGSDTIELKRFFGQGNELKYWSTFDLEAVGAGRVGKGLNFKKLWSFFSKKDRQKYWSSNHKVMVNRLEAVSQEWAEVLDFSQLGLALVDDPIYFLPLLKKLKKEGVPVVAVSHNIDSLVPYQAAWQHQKSLLNRELEVLAKCDLVVTISREETWLLKNFDINALFFPYYPVDEILNRMLRVRNFRKKSDKRDFLILGTAINTATSQGMSAVIDVWKNKKLFQTGHRLLVAGFMTDIFLKDKKNESNMKANIEFLGPVTDEELDEILGSIKGCIVYQQWGAGALTRIMEMLTAGVPVLINSHAARSYYHIEGVVEFQDLNELGSFFEEIGRFEAGGQFPLPPKPNTALLAARIKKLMEQRS